MEQNMNNAGEMQISQRVLGIMKVTKRWTRFLSVFGFVITGIIFLIAVFQFSSVKEVMLMFESTNLIFVVLGAIAFFAAPLSIYFIPSLLLSRYASSITKLLKSGDAPAMETALDRQKTFWKYSGILILAILLIYGLFIVAFSTYLIPKFIGLKTNNEALMNSAPCESQKDWFVAAINAGIYQVAESETADTNLNKYPSKLDSSHDGPASDSNPFFGEVLTEGVSSSNWSKEGNRYTLKCEGKKYVFKYNPATGEFGEKSD